jgi:hypothetical protein
MTQDWREQEARVMQMVTCALAVGREAALQQLERLLAQQLMEVGDERQQLFEHKAATCVVCGCFDGVFEKLEEKVAETLENMELRREIDGQ